jgi:hypothetical protein
LNTTEVQHLEEKLDYAIENLSQARPFNKGRYQQMVLDVAGRLLSEPQGIPVLYEQVSRIDEAGIFHGTDWAYPGTLLPSLVRSTLESGEKQTVVIEVLSDLRMLAISQGKHSHAGVSAEQANHFLTQVLALNLHYIFGPTDEATRVRLGSFAESVQELFRFLLEKTGFEDILGQLIEEIWRILSQRPIQVDHVKTMITQIAIAMTQEGFKGGDATRGADRLISALFGPTVCCKGDPGAATYEQALTKMDLPSLKREASGFQRAMLDVGLVSDYHIVFLRWILKNDHDTLIPDALGLTSVGMNAFHIHEKLVQILIDQAAHFQTSQSVYGLHRILESGLLFHPPIAPALWRQIDLKLSDHTTYLFHQFYGETLSPTQILLAGTLSLLGQPLGIGQGNNPTCQSARALSMWAHNDADYLLDLIAHAAVFDNLVIHFEGQPISSAALESGMTPFTPLDTDPVSMVLVPHLDRIYVEMGRRCVGRGDDPHRWINPELHGWWVGRDFLIAVDVATGKLTNYDQFIHRFYQSYHPHYNGNHPIIHPQPAGLAVTDSKAKFIGWHAITLIRVAPDQDNIMRIYFFNPNNDSGQNWGNGIQVSTQGNGEQYGEASLPFGEMLSRLYIYHDDLVSSTPEKVVPLQEVESVKMMAAESWAKERV